MRNQIIIKHSENGMSIGGVYYAIHDGPRHPDVAYINRETGCIDAMQPCLCYGSHGQAKASVIESAQRAAAACGAAIIDESERL